MKGSPACVACDVVSGARRSPGGVLLREAGLLVHAFLDPTPLRGWLVVTSERHARAWYDLEPGALAALGPLAARVMRAQREALGAEHVYAFAIGDALRHFHLHLVPRYADTPDRLRGRGAFDGRPGDAIAEGEALAAIRSVAARL